MEGLGYTNKMVMNLALSNQARTSADEAWRAKDVENKLVWLLPIGHSVKPVVLGEFIRSCLTALSDHKYRREGDRCVQEKMLPPKEGAEGGAQLHSRYWEPVCTIREFLYSTVQMDIDPVAWNNMLARGSIVKDTIEYLMNCCDSQFEPIEREMRVWSFSNGVYDGSTDTGYTYNALTGLPSRAMAVDSPNAGTWTSEASDTYPASRVACLFIPFTFPIDWAVRNDEVAFEDIGNCDHWQHIPTPSFDMIPKKQRMSAKVTQWLWVFRGRVFYEMRERENWQVMPLLRGAGGTGKTTYTQNIKRTHPHNKVPTMSSNAEKQFGLGMLRHGWSFIIPELRTDNFNVCEGEMLQIISGDPVSLAIKFGDAEQLENWKLHGTAAANAPLQFVDSHGAWARRIVEFEFPHILNKDEVKTTLDDDLEKELPFIILKANRAYRSATKQYRGQGIWNVLPDEFGESKKKLESRTNPMEGFITSGKVVLHWAANRPSAGTDGHAEPPLDKCTWCTEGDMRAAFKAYCHDSGMKVHIRFDEDLYKGHFERHGVRLIQHQPDNTEVPGKFFINAKMQPVAAAPAPPPPPAASFNLNPS
jgi:hypothetical protein